MPPDVEGVGVFEAEVDAAVFDGTVAVEMVDVDGFFVAESEVRVEEKAEAVGMELSFNHGEERKPRIAVIGDAKRASAVGTKLPIKSSIPFTPNGRVEFEVEVGMVGAADITDAVLGDAANGSTGRERNRIANHIIEPKVAALRSDAAKAH